MQKIILVIAMLITLFSDISGGNAIPQQYHRIRNLLLWNAASSFFQPFRNGLGGTLNISLANAYNDQNIRDTDCSDFSGLLIMTFHAQIFQIAGNIPGKNMGIEVDGIIWHSELFGKKDKTYHLNKTNRSQTKNVDLIHIW
ncbi:MAG: hypothetical protein WCP86_12010, partial [bacterium]